MSTIGNSESNNDINEQQQVCVCHLPSGAEFDSRGFPTCNEGVFPLRQRCVSYVIAAMIMLCTHPQLPSVFRYVTETHNVSTRLSTQVPGMIWPMSHLPESAYNDGVSVDGTL